MKAIFSFLALGGLILAIGLAVRATLQIDEIREQRDALATQDTLLRKATAAGEQRLRVANSALARLETGAARPVANSKSTSETKAATSELASGAEAPVPARPTKPAHVIANDPRWMANYAQDYRVSLDLVHGGMFKALGLSPQQVERLKDLWAEIRQQEMDIEAVAEKQGLDRNSDAVRKLMAGPSKLAVAREAEILGDKMASVLEYRRTQNVRKLAQRLAGDAIFSGETVTAAQVEQTTQIMVANSQRASTSPRRGWADPSTVNWDAARVQLQGVISPRQIETLGELVRWSAEQTKANELRARLTAEFKAKQAGG